MIQDEILSFPPLPTPAQMRQWDAKAIDFGIPEKMLMENASLALLNCLEALNLINKGNVVWLFMGNGNNGGDAAALARHLLEKKIKPMVFHTSPLESAKGAARWHIDLALASGVFFQKLSPLNSDHPHKDLFLQLLGTESRPDLIIDGLLGTGFNGSLRPELQNLVTGINNLVRWLKCPVAAIDTPSGLDSITGSPLPVAIKATCTITLEAAKPGIVLPHAKPWAGKVYCRSIGMPNLQDYPCDEFLLDGRIFTTKPHFANNSYKNNYGHIYVIGGASGMEGAAQLASLAALRSGCGLVTVCAPSVSLPPIKGSHPEIMTLAMGNNVSWPEQIPAETLDIIFAASALIIGPGMGRSSSALSMLEKLLFAKNRPPAILDADCLTLVGQNPSLIGGVTENDIITPHPGEAGVFLHCKSIDVQHDRTGALEALKNLLPCVIILKGASTRIGKRGMPNLLCPYDIPHLAIAGAGDVLAGCAGAFLSKPDFNPFKAATFAVMTHAVAGMICASHYPNRGTLASDLADFLPHVHEYISSQSDIPLQRGMMPWPILPSIQ